MVKSMTVGRMIECFLNGKSKYNKVFLDLSRVPHFKFADTDNYLLFKKSSYKKGKNEEESESEDEEEALKKRPANETRGKGYSYFFRTISNLVRSCHLGKPTDPNYGVKSQFFDGDEDDYLTLSHEEVQLLTVPSDHLLESLFINCAYNAKISLIPFSKMLAHISHNNLDFTKHILKYMQLLCKEDYYGAY